MTIKSRLLGFAFASADLLLEIDGAGRISLVLGAGPVPGSDPAASWVGRALNDLLGKASRKAVESSLATAASGVRSTPVDILIHCDEGRVRRARFSAFQLPDLAPAISCSLAWEGAPFSLDIPQAPAFLDAGGLINRVRDRMAEPSEEGFAFAFVDIPGLGGPGEPHQRAAARIEAVLQSVSLNGESAARLAPERFAILRGANDPRDLAAEVEEASLAEGLTLRATTSQVAVAADAPVHTTLKALRFALESCIRDGGLARPDIAFSDSLRQTMKDADQFRSMVRARQFEIQYQPIVDLQTGDAHHFEALARLGGKTGPAATIRMAEELGLIEGFDIAVLEKVIGQLRRPGFGLVRVAANVSGASLATDAYVQSVLHQTSGDPDLRRRLIIEVTETAVIGDLDAANRRIAALRKAGVRVCLDDFGMGAASWDYVRRLKADIVKIDGAFVQDVAENPRSRTLVSHLVELCAELDMKTVAEMIETDAQADIMRELKVTYGQGWLFGRPTAEPVMPRAQAPALSRRRGEVVGWG
jgi:EAL domain-containing protein (putative c-di-GMP-specific phosphodiesterase class I)